MGAMTKGYPFLFFEWEAYTIASVITALIFTDFILPFLRSVNVFSVRKNGTDFIANAPKMAESIEKLT